VTQEGERMTDTILYHDDTLLEQPLPPRRRGKLVTRSGAAFAALAIAALGFVAGVQVQKTHGETAGNGRPDFAGALPGGGQTQADDATVGEVSSVDAKAFYVEDANGNTIRVRTDKDAKVSRNAVADADAIHPGDAVVVQGRTASNGTVVATSVIATASNAEGGAGLLGFGSGGGGPSASAPRGDG
jgi:hypothetical protein